VCFYYITGNAAEITRARSSRRQLEVARPDCRSAARRSVGPYFFRGDENTGVRQVIEDSEDAGIPHRRRRNNSDYFEVSAFVAGQVIAPDFQWTPVGHPASDREKFLPDRGTAASADVGRGLLGRRRNPGRLIGAGTTPRKSCACPFADRHGRRQKRAGGTA
jgi:hypothetical protein